MEGASYLVKEPLSKGTSLSFSRIWGKHQNLRGNQVVYGGSNGNPRGYWAVVQVAYSQLGRLNTGANVSL